MRTALFTNDFLKKISASAIDEIFLRENETVHFENAHVMGVNICHPLHADKKCNNFFYKITRGKRYFRIKWEGFNSKDNSWKQEKKHSEYVNTRVILSQCNNR